MAEKQLNNVKITSVFSEASSRENIKSGETLGTIFGKVQKNINDTNTDIETLQNNLSTHVGDINNPHSVTKDQVGLSNVENKSSADIRSEITDTDISEALTYIPVSPNELSEVSEVANTANNKADEALARNNFTDAHKSKLESITNPMLIKGTVASIDLLPTEAEVGWFYFVGADGSDTFDEYIYTENGTWEFIGVSEEGIDLVNYYMIDEVDTLLADKLNNTTKYAVSDSVGGSALKAVADENGENIAEHFESVEHDIDTVTLDKSVTGASVQLANLQGGVPFSKIELSGENIVGKEITLNVCGKNILPQNFTPRKATNITSTIDENGVITVNTSNPFSGNSSAVLWNENTLIPISVFDNGVSICMTWVDGIFSGSDTTTGWFGIRGHFFDENKEAIGDYIYKNVKGYKGLNLIATLTKDNIEIPEGAKYFTCTMWIPTNGYLTDFKYTLHMELGNTATEFEPYHGYTKTFVPIESPFVLIENLEQYEGTNTLMVSAGELSVTGVKKNAALNNIWGELNSVEVGISNLQTQDQTFAEEIADIKNDVAINKSTLGYSGKNLLNASNITLTQAGYIVAVNDCNIPSGSYIFSYNTTGSPITCEIVAYNGDTEVVRKAYYQNTGHNEITFTTDKKITRFRAWDNVAGEYTNFMIRSVDITDSTYEPYVESVDERIINNDSDISINKSTLGYTKKNLLKNTATTTTINGVTFTVNEDKSVTVNGTATANATLHLTDSQKLTLGKKYILSGCPAGGNNSTTYRLFGLSFYNGWVGNGEDCGEGGEFTATESELYTYRMSVYKGCTVNNLTFYPMLRYAEITDDTYEPYIEDVDTRLSTLENVGATKVEDSSTNGNIKINGTETTVYTLTPAGTSLGGVKSGGNVSISDGTITVNDDSHNHVISNIDGLQTALDGKLPHTTITTAIDINTLQTTGVYHIKVSGCTNVPTSHWGTVYVDFNTGTPYQIYIADDSTVSIYKRGYKSSNWTDWVNLYSLSSFGVTATATELNYVDGVTSNIQTQLNGKASSSHTHSYAGSSSAGGVATSAAKLSNTSEIGSATNPVYFTSGGVPSACTYTLSKSVPSGAVFTDANVTQTYTNGSANYPLLMKSSSGVTATTSPTSTTRYGNTVYANPSTGQLFANMFYGNSGALLYSSNIAAASGTITINNLWNYGQLFMDVSNIGGNLYSILPQFCIPLRTIYNGTSVKMYYTDDVYNTGSLYITLSKSSTENSLAISITGATKIGAVRIYSTI